MKRRASARTAGDRLEQEVVHIPRGQDAAGVVLEQPRLIALDVELRERHQLVVAQRVALVPESRQGVEDGRDRLAVMPLLDLEQQPAAPRSKRARRP